MRIALNNVDGLHTFGSTFFIQNNSTVELTLIGTNTLVSGSTAGLGVPAGSSLTGSLDVLGVNGAGIGGGNCHVGKGGMGAAVGASQVMDLVSGRRGTVPWVWIISGIAVIGIVADTVLIILRKAGQNG